MQRERIHNSQYHQALITKRKIVRVQVNGFSHPTATLNMFTHTTLPTSHKAHTHLDIMRRKKKKKILRK